MTRTTLRQTAVSTWKVLPLYMILYGLSLGLLVIGEHVFGDGAPLMQISEGALVVLIVTLPPVILFIGACHAVLGASGTPDGLAETAPRGDD